MEKWKRLLLEAQAAAKAARDIAAKAEGRGEEMTETERAEYDAKFAEATQKKGASDQAKKDAESQKTLAELAGDDGDAPEGDVESSPVKVKDRQEQFDTVQFGERFTKSKAYEQFRKEHPGGHVGNGSPIQIGRVKVGSLDEWHNRRKALTSPQAHVQNIRMPMVDQVDRDRLTILDLISRGQTDGDFEYVQVTGVTRGAAVVPEDTTGADAAALKPVSDMTTTLADAKVFTYADGYNVTNKLLTNAPAFASYMNNELSYSLDNVVEEELLNGSGAAGNPRGILNTTGVQSQEYALGGDTMAKVKAIRSAITKVTRLPGGTVTAIVLSPELDEAIDLLQDGQQRFYGQGPFGSGPATLWGRPRAISERLAEGTVILGDWRQVALLDQEGLSVLAFNQHKDFAQRNMTYVRAELSAAQVIWKPNRLVVVTEAAA